MDKLTDWELIRAFCKGQPKAFEVLFRRYKTDMLRVVVHYVRDSTLAEDLSQEIFIKVFSAMKEGRYNEEGKFLSWLLRIAHNTCMDHLKKPNRVSYVDSFSTFVQYSQTTVSPEEVMINRQKYERLARLVHTLPEDQRKVIAYRHYEEMSFKEIAEKTGTSVSTSLGRMRYGVMHLRKAMKKDPVFKAL